MRGEKQSETSGISSAMHAFALVKPGESTTMLAIADDVPYRRDERPAARRREA